MVDSISASRIRLIPWAWAGTRAAGPTSHARAIAPATKWRRGNFLPLADLLVAGLSLSVGRCRLETLPGGQKAAISLSMIDRLITLRVLHYAPPIRSRYHKRSS